ncbi:hypothetical protein ACJMK2_028648 [Sinanodonta woodiana]|uniref:Amino acid transporter transmembrane domain-containing protein n=1 Tax=Sinanodonta woodiana TaxID=1069815 RepID=A0ABD3X9I0_SINWO
MEDVFVSHVQEGGLNIFKTSVFVSGVIAGAGVLALPNAVKGSGDVGIMLMFLACFMSAYTGIILGRTWLLILKRYPQYRETRARYPYPLIGEITFGKFGRHLVSFAINFTLFGAAVVYLVVSAENIHSLVQEVYGDVHACYWALIVAGALAPFTFLNTPKDFWLVALGATGTTAIACIILLTNISMDKSSHRTVKHTTPDFISFSTAFGTMCFAFGGHPSFPTFQEDMREKKKFWKAVIIGYILVILMYIPVSTTAYFVYGDDIQDNILHTVSKGPMYYTMTILLTLHFLFGFIILLNPVNQELEHLFKVPDEFTWKRILSRTLLVAGIVFVAETIPHFGLILSLIGGSTTTLLVFILPPLFYLKLCRMHPDLTANEKSGRLPLYTMVLNILILVVGIAAGAASTYSGLHDVISGKFTPPCYISITSAD